MGRGGEGKAGEVEGGEGKGGMERGREGRGEEGRRGEGGEGWEVLLHGCWGDERHCAEQGRIQKFGLGGTPSLSLPFSPPFPLLPLFPSLPPGRLGGHLPPLPPPWIRRCMQQSAIDLRQAACTISVGRVIFRHLDLGHDEDTGD